MTGGTQTMIYILKNHEQIKSEKFIRVVFVFYLNI